MNIHQAILDLPEHEIKLLLADAAVFKWMEQKENLAYLRALQAEYLHQKGWSIYGRDKAFKREAIIPPDAYLHLPLEWRKDPKRKEMLRWIKERHPYLMMKTQA